jgi:uncharacterized membrane protein
MRAVAAALLWFLSLSVAVYALAAYTLLPLGATIDPGMRPSFVAHATAVHLHAFAASTALLLGPLQLWTKLRAARPALHRWMGRAYLGIGVLVGGLSGLYLALFAYGGVSARLGFGALAAAWLYTGVRAFLAIRAGAVAEHRRWMCRNFALTFAAVMLRLYVPAAVVAGAEFEQAYTVIAWLCWVPNLLVIEWFLRRPATPRIAV